MKVFLTGASSGIGEAFARHYASRGAQLGLVARRADLLQNLAATLSPAPLTYPVDVRDAKALAAAARDFITRVGTPDIVIANAGVSRGMLTEHAEDLEVFRHILEVNVLGMAHTFHPFVAAMRARGVGTLVGIASVAGVRGVPGGGAYSSSKAAAITYCESLRVELRDSGIKVVTICPGYIRTPMTAVNRFKMPFIIEVDAAVQRFAQVIDRGQSYAVVPWKMGVAAAILRLLPNWAFDRIFARLPRKPR